MKQTLFPKITAVFSRTTMLSVKVNTLICFHSMVKTLDKFTLTEKLVPLLAKIKTKEPAVMVATLAVHEALGNKCEIEASSSPLLSPRIWADGDGQSRLSSSRNCGPCQWDPSSTRLNSLNS